MQGSLHLDQGVLYVGSHELSAHVRTFDLQGRRLEAGFSFRPADGGRSSVDGLAVDVDRRVWIADGAARRLRVFTLFGVEIAGVGPEAPARTESKASRREHRAGDDRAGELGAPADVLSSSSDDEQHLVVASGGRRRHALQVLELGSGRTRSLRPLGDPLGRFGGLCDIAVDGRLLYACERLAGRVQVFRDGEFHYAFTLPVAGGRFEPRAIAPLGEGRLLICQGGPASALLLVGPCGVLLRVLAEQGGDTGEVLEPNDVVVERGDEERGTRAVVIDRDGDRVQVFTLAGACEGAFPDFLEQRG